LNEIAPPRQLRRYVALLLTTMQIGASHKNVHTILRVACLFSILIVLLFAYLSHKYMELDRNTWLVELEQVWFLVSPAILVSVAAVESVRLRRVQSEMRAIAIDWFCVIAYLPIWFLGFLWRVMTPLWV
jgi:hypothetical protein